MKYKKLINFNIILNREDFTFISNKDTIKNISQIVQHCINFPDGEEQNHIKYITYYLNNLTSFCSWIGDNPEIKKGYLICQLELERTIGLLDEAPDKREAISRGNIRTFKNNFLDGLNLIYESIKDIFNHPKDLNLTSITREQILKFFFDKKEGLGSRFSYNKVGRFAIANKLSDLNKEELIFTEKLLVERPEAQVRTSNIGWITYGSGRSLIRIVTKRKEQNNLYFLFKNTDAEKDDYTRHLGLQPNNVEFKAA